MKKIVVFGATSAIGEAVIHEFAKEDIELYLVGRQHKKTMAIVNDLSIRYPSIKIHMTIVDLADTTNHSKLLQKIIDEIGTIDIAFIAYGLLTEQKTCELSYEATYHAIQVNLLSVISLLTHLANQLEQQRHGLIAVITSVAGDRGRQSNYIYGTAKGGLNIFLQGLRHRLHRFDVHVLTIKPGFIDTPMTKHLKKNILWASPVTIAKQIKKAIDRKYDVIYVPRFWVIIMTFICWLPERVFKRLAL